MFQIISEAMTASSAGSSRDFLPNPNAAALKRAERWLKDRIARGHKETFSETIDLTPEVASVLLTLNSNNRKLRETVVSGYAKDIASGRWSFNGESIIVCSDDILSSGQHRCHAVIQAGASITTIIVFGVDPESRRTVDGGLAKTAGDHLQAEGFGDALNLAAAAVRIISIDNYGRAAMTGMERPTKQESMEFVRSNPDLAVSLRAVAHDGSAKIAPRSLLAAAHFILARRDAKSADAFMDALIAGDNLSRQSPIYVLREKLLAKDKRLNDNERMKAICMAWNNWRAGRSVRTLTHSMERGEKLPDLR